MSSTSYYYELNDGGVTVIVVDEPGPLNTWWSTPEANCLVVEAGSVTEEKIGLISGTGTAGNDAVVTLKEASWKSNVGDTGTAVAHLAHGCSPTKWELKKII